MGCFAAQQRMHKVRGEIRLPIKCVQRLLPMAVVMPVTVPMVVMPAPMVMVPMAVVMPMHLLWLEAVDIALRYHGGLNVHACGHRRCL